MFIKYFNNKEVNKIYLPMKIKNKLDVAPQKLILNIGVWKKEVNVSYNEELDDNTIGISDLTLDGFIIPETLPYDVRIDGRNIFIGPVIAFLAATSENGFNDKVLSKLKNYYNNYKHLKGLIYICSADSINTLNKTIKGYYFEESSAGEIQWKSGVFPYPGSMYRRVGLPISIYNDIINQLGDKLFNSYFFNKWEMWETLSPYPHIREHLPHTEKLKGLEELDRMLDLYGSAYLKLVSGQSGKGIIKAEKYEDGYHFNYRFDPERVIKDIADLKSYIDSLNEPEGNYIVQQPIIVKKHDDRNFDFRAILQKDTHNQWGCTGIIARFGEIDSITTNFLAAGYTMDCYTALKTTLKLSEKAIFKKEQEIINLCREACQILDKSIGNYGDLGIDLIIDENQKIWILEINKLHDYKFPLYNLNNIEMHNHVISKPFEYAKSLCGF